MTNSGHGRSTAKKMSGFMNLPNLVTYSVWSRKTEKHSETVIDLADKQMKDICENISDSNKDITDSGVSIDGAWQTRGMSAHHGFVTAISIESKQVVDRHYMTNHCNQCSKWERKSKDTAEYMEYFADHFPNCSINHEGFAHLSPHIISPISFHTNQLAFIPIKIY